MNYLTRISNITGDDYQVHQQLKDIFDQDRILFQRGTFETVVLSNKMPTVSQPPMVTKQISDFFNSINWGSEFLFTIRLNPVVTTKVDQKSKRIPIERNKLRAWIDDKLTNRGMRAEFIYNTEGPRTCFKKSHKITLSSVFVTGMCQVEDRDLFNNAITKGIGHAKGLGFGMLNIFANL